MLATSYTLTATTELGFTEAVERVRGELKSEGFGVLCEIDVQATMRDKLGIERRALPDPRCLQPAACPPGPRSRARAWRAPSLQCRRLPGAGADAARCDRSRTDALDCRQRRARPCGGRCEGPARRRRRACRRGLRHKAVSIQALASGGSGVRGSSPFSSIAQVSPLLILAGASRGSFPGAGGPF